MTWTYDTSLAASRDKIRFYAADIDSTAAITLSDEEIAGVLSMAGGVRAAAAMCCDTLALRYAQRGQSLTDDIGQSINYGTIADAFKERARLLRSQAAFAATPYAGGISVADKQLQQDDDDRALPFFARDTQDAPGTRTHSRDDLDLTEQP